MVCLWGRTIDAATINRIYEAIAAVDPDAATGDPAEVAAAFIHRLASDHYYHWRALPTGEQRDFLAALEAPKRGTYVLLGGNRSGKTETAGYAFARMVRKTLAPLARERKAQGLSTPVWVIGQTMDMVGGICWKQKLRRLLPATIIEDIAWAHKMLGYPAMVRLHNGIEIHFKSAAQGREALQGEAIFAAWIDEQIAEDVREEVEMRCLDHRAPILMSQTPLEPDADMQRRYEEPPDGWWFYRIDIEDNRTSRGGHLDDTAVDQILAQIREENPAMYETRKSGAFAGMAGLIYPMFGTGTHVIDAEDADRRARAIITGGGHLVLGVDFGLSVPTSVLYLAYEPSEKQWITFDEVYQSHVSIDLILSRMQAVEQRHGLVGKVRAAYCDTGDLTATGTTKDDHKRSGRQALREAGYPVVNAAKAFWPGVSAVQSALARVVIEGVGGVEYGPPRMLVSSRCSNLIREVRGYTLDDKGTERRDPADAKPRKKNDHAVDAWRYAVHTHGRGSVGMTAEGFAGAKRTLGMELR